MKSMRVWITLASLAALLLASAASAQNKFAFTGKFARSNGAYIDVPVVGATLCPEVTWNLRLTYNSTPAKTEPGPTQPSLTANKKGCVKHAGLGATITTTGAGEGGKFTMPTDFFTQGLPFPSNGMVNVVPVPVAPNVVQLASSFAFNAPPSKLNAYTRVISEPMGTMNNGSNTAPFKVFQTSAWVGQTGRAGADFTWCPNDGGTMEGTGANTCQYVTQNPAQRELIVRYTAGTNKFGGTMSHILKTGSSVSSLGVVGGVVPGGGVAFLELEAGTGSSQPSGRGYADFLTDMLGSGPIWPMYELTSGGTTTGTGNVISKVTGPSVPFGIPEDTNNNWGFPWTTGMVLARNSGTALAQPINLTVSATGFDTTQMSGGGMITARNISLVSGALAFTSTLMTETAGMTFMRLVPEPGRSLQLLGGVFGLLMIGAWRARKVRG